MTTTPNARFWIYLNDSFTKITLRPGQTVSHYWAAKHDEGWSSEYQQWTHDGSSVVREMTRDGRDCDGRLCTDQRDQCPLEQLHSWPCTLPNAPMLPSWQDIETTQYDQFAEASGY